MATVKEIILQERVTIWSQRTVRVVCPADEDDAATFERLRHEGVDADYEAGDQEFFFETETAVADGDYPNSLDFGDRPGMADTGLGVQSTEDNDEDSDQE